MVRRIPLFCFIFVVLLTPAETRAIRRRLKGNEATNKTVRQQKREAYYPLRKFAIKA